MTFYKFRNFSNYKFLLDIIVNQRLYASSFRSLNDNLEGQFTSNTFGDTKKVRLNPKREEHLSICSFSENYRSHLLWSHYADGHRGMAFGFTIDNSKYDIQKVNYNGLSHFDDLPITLDEKKQVFLNKIKDWEYEEEYRVISEKQCFIDIKIEKIIFGTEASKADKELVTKLVELIDKNIAIETYKEF